MGLDLDAVISAVCVIPDQIHMSSKGCYRMRDLRQTATDKTPGNAVMNILRDSRKRRDNVLDAVGAR